VLHLGKFVSSFLEFREAAKPLSGRHLRPPNASMSEMATQAILYLSENRNFTYRRAEEANRTLRYQLRNVNQDQVTDGDPLGPRLLILGHIQADRRVTTRWLEHGRVRRPFGLSCG
jgi:hypothetical protein